MSLKISKIIRFLLSIKSILFINLLIRFKKIFNKNLKVIFFYFPVKSYQDNILELIDVIKKEKNIEVILGYNLGSSNEVKNYEKAFFLNLGYLKFIKQRDRITYNKKNMILKEYYNLNKIGLEKYNTQKYIRNLYSEYKINNIETIFYYDKLTCTKKKPKSNLNNKDKIINKIKNYFI